MRMILATASLALLAACGGGASNNSAGNAAAGAPAAPANPAVAARRANEMRECADDVRNELPAGTDLDAFCGCTVDKLLQDSNVDQRQAMQQCATQMGIQTRN